jgi:hypothetical protein
MKHRPRLRLGAYSPAKDIIMQDLNQIRPMPPGLIVVSDGTASGTKVLTPSGEKLPGVVSVNFDSIDSDAGIVEATIRFNFVRLGKES